MHKKDQRIRGASREQVKLLPKKVVKPNIGPHKSVPKSTLKQKQNSQLNKKMQKKQIVVLPNPADLIAQLITKILAIQISNNSFEQSWEQFANLVGQHINFITFLPQFKDKIGEQLLTNGKFITLWAEIVSKNIYVNINLILKHISQKYLPAIKIEKQTLETFLSAANAEKTPHKAVQAQNLKRSILKNSQKKVQFGKNEIVYPPLESYVPVTSVKNTTCVQGNSILEIRKKHGYLLDYYQINDVFFPKDVEIVGVLQQISPYAIILIKMKQGDNFVERTCIAVTKDDAIHQDNIQILKKIEKLYENLGYLEINGKSTAELWVDSLPSQKVQ